MRTYLNILRLALLLAEATSLIPKTWVFFLHFRRTQVSVLNSLIRLLMGDLSWVSFATIETKTCSEWAFAKVLCYVWLSRNLFVRMKISKWEGFGVDLMNIWRTLTHVFSLLSQIQEEIFVLKVAIIDQTTLLPLLVSSSSNNEGSNRLIVTIHPGNFSFTCPTLRNKKNEY